ncbi:MAG: hypothetical protein ABI577_05480 [bacterium]
MVHPILTIFFDLFIIGAALTISSAMVAEFLASREPQVGTTRKYQPRPQLQARRRATMHRLPAQRRRAA